MTDIAEVPSSAPLYRLSVLATALTRMWRGWRVIIPVVGVNAAVQSLLLLPGVLPYLSVAFVIVAVAGILALVALFGLLAVVALQSAVGPVDAALAMRVAVRRFWLLLAWSVALLVLVLMGLAMYVVPGLILLAATPFVLLAVADGRRNPIAANMRVIGARWGRWLVTVLIMAVICLGLWLFGATDGFFVTGAPGGFIAWLVFGLVSAWFIGAWALVYRSVLTEGLEPGQA